MPQHLLALVILLCCLNPAAAETGLAQASSAFKAGMTSDFGQAPRFLTVEEAYQLAPLLVNDQLVLHWDAAPGYYLYRHRFEAHTADGQELKLTLPSGTTREDPYFGRVEVYYRSVEAVVTGHPDTPFTLAITSQGCADAGLCFPPHTEQWHIDPSAGSAERIATTEPFPASSGEPIRNGSAVGPSWLLMAGLALLGGALLNLMPCVFPVLGLKALSFRSAEGGALKHGFSYTAGVVLSFVSLAAALLALRSTGLALGWGFQLQHPAFVGALAYLFTALGLSLSGVWSFGARWMGAGQRWTEQEGLTGSFFTGVLATVVASPCTAPLMGTAIGFALLQPALPALSLFAALGLGMALPLLAVSASPQLQRRLPRPGPWMDRVKQALAFPLYASAIWLVWVIGRQSGANGMGLVLLGALAIAFAAWLLRFGRAGRGIAIGCVVAALALLASKPLQYTASTTAEVTTTERYSEDALAELRAAGRPVLLNATADWCLTCLANERVALSSDDVQQALAAQGITYMVADWTHYDPAITRLLAKFGRGGVPLYVFYPPAANATPAVLPQILTRNMVLRAIGATDPAS